MHKNVISEDYSTKALWSIFKNTFTKEDPTFPCLTLGGKESDRQLRPDIDCVTVCYQSRHTSLLIMSLVCGVCSTDNAPRWCQISRKSRYIYNIRRYTGTDIIGALIHSTLIPPTKLLRTMQTWNCMMSFNMVTKSYCNIKWFSQDGFPCKFTNLWNIRHFVPRN